MDFPASFILATLPALAACAPPPAEPAAPSVPAVQTWGSMREVLKQGHTEGRVELASVVQPSTVGVGALAGLAGEITILDGEVFVAVAVASSAPPAADGANDLQVRGAADGDQASLLVVAEVAAWESQELPACGSYTELEEAVAAVITAKGLDLAGPVPFRVEGTASQLELHVIAGACPIANPSGPPPWRFHGEGGPVEIVGFFADGAAGSLTHHNRRSHVHAVTKDRAVAGHLDEVVLLAGARLLLPE